MNIKELAYKEEPAYLNTLKSLVKLESPSSDKAAVDALADFLEELLRADGWLVERLPQASVGDQLVARWDAGAGSSSLLLCHFDTVWPLGTLEVMPIKEKDGLLYGPGVLDMKAGITNAIHAMRIIKEAGLTLAGPVTLLLTTDEETGSHHSRELIEALAQEHDRVLVLEPGRDDGAYKIGRKGTGDFRVRIKGISAHAGNNPKEGASALRELAHFLFYAESLTDDNAATSVNVTVATAGSASNVIAEDAIANIDVRVLTLDEQERVTKALHAYKPKDPRVTVEILGGVNRPPLELTDANKALTNEFKQHLKTLNIELESSVVGGGSDGNFTSALGVATLDGLGSSGMGPHARHEHIRVRESLERLALLVALLTRSQA